MGACAFSGGEIWPRSGTFRSYRPEELLQSDSPARFAEACRVLRDRKLGRLLAAGVSIRDLLTTWIDLDVRIGRGTTIYPSVIIEGKSRIGRRCQIYPFAHLINCVVGDDVKIFSSSVIEDSVIEDEAWVGPFSRLRPKAHLRARARVGNFVEMKNTRFGRDSKAMHLSYLGDSDIDAGVNIGAGTITCNFDGFKKHRTKIASGAFIGSGSELVAPVKVGRGAYVGAGSTITKNVSPGALAVARGRQIERRGWAARKKRKK
jgi:bifunctional UDP-N-acetylglucosamine pyrophosphorylase/glucosamine-1-phosphate N-acetyltransferase